jgi:monoamine oxidase
VRARCAYEEDRLLIKTQVAVIGGGVAGLNTARLLRGSGVQATLFEARSRLGGRVLTVDATGAPSRDGFDLGPSWIWPRMQPAIGSLVEELGLSTFAQRSEGDVVFERMSRESAQRYPTPHQEPQSLRLTGGASAIVDALSATLPTETVQLDATVTELALTPDEVRLSIRRADGHEETVEAEQVVAALPPRLLEATVGFAPSLPATTSTQWQSTPTWMAPHAKFFALYDRPFWIEAGYSGTAQSMVGPMLEIHDATTRSGQGALFGFLGVGATERARLGRDVLAKGCVDQLARLFGRQAETPVATLYKDWAGDPLTATAGDIISTGHPVAAATWVPQPWSTRLVLAGSETSPNEAGYLAGAVEASGRAAADVLERVRSPGPTR